MAKRILLISDIHGNYPSLAATHAYFKSEKFDAIINCGDSLVYAPFPNDVLNWLRQQNALSILGNTDKKVIKLLKKLSLKKPTKPEKRIMYRTTASTLTAVNAKFLQSFKKKSHRTLHIGRPDEKKAKITVGIFHGSPAANHEFLFDTTHSTRFEELAANCSTDIVVTGHSHTPYHKKIAGIHFVNPGSIGRMFDGKPTSSCATLTISTNTISVEHYRIPYDIEAVTREITRQGLPDIYSQMYRLGRKLN
jgi:putative phosphoesterase